MVRLLWAFTVQNPQSPDTLSSTPAPETTKRFRRFGVNSTLTKFSLPKIPSDTAVFQVYLHDSGDLHSTDLDSFYSPLKETPVDYGQEIVNLVKSRDYNVELVATRGSSEESPGEKLYSAKLSPTTIPYLLSDSIPLEAKQHKQQELEDSILSLLFGLPLPRKPPLWVTMKSSVKVGDSKGSEKDILMLQIRRGFLLKTVQNWSPYDAELIGEIPLQRIDTSVNGNANTVYNMLFQGSAQMMHAQRRVSQLSSQMELLANQLNEFVSLKEKSEAELLEKALVVLNKKKEKLEQLRTGVDIPDDDDSALYDFYTKIGEFSRAGLTVDVDQNDGFDSREPPLTVNLRPPPYDGLTHPDTKTDAFSSTAIKREIPETQQSAKKSLNIVTRETEGEFSKSEKDHDIPPELEEKFRRRYKRRFHPSTEKRKRWSSSSSDNDEHMKIQAEEKEEFQSNSKLSDGSDTEDSEP